MSSARDTYTARLSKHKLRVEALTALDARVADGRLAAFGLIIGIAVVAWLGWLSTAWIAVPIIGFVALVLWHTLVDERMAVAKHGAEYYELGLARLEGKWQGKGITENFAPADHPYASDLDLFGRGSLFDRMCLAQTRAGQYRLARWLLAPASHSDIQARQEAIVALRDRVDLREDLARLGRSARELVQPDLIERWAHTDPKLPTTLLSLMGTTCALAFIGALGGWMAGWWGPIPLLSVVAVEILFARFVRNGVEKISSAVAPVDTELQILGDVLARWESESFDVQMLREMGERLTREGLPASKAIRRLSRLVQLLESRQNQMFGMVAFVLMWAPLYTAAIERWRRRFGPLVPHWLDAVAELEALSSLAGYAYENPSDPFAEIEPNTLHFWGTQLRHPLLPLEGCVPNDVRLGDGPQVLLISGSNMSGKSTLLRTVGLNTVLAMAGAPVRAQSLHISPVRVGATLRVQDSLQEGASRFYAEIQRIRTVVEIAEAKHPLLFLMDEILHGTNSHDRRVGAQAVISGLVERGAIGLVTTHDLALTDLAQELHGRVQNVHFEDEIQGDKLSFDYRLKPGVVSHSNALDLMRAVGLQI